MENGIPFVIPEALAQLGVIGVLFFVLGHLLRMYREKDNQLKTLNAKVLEAFQDQAKIGERQSQAIEKLSQSLDKNTEVVQQSSQIMEKSSESMQNLSNQVMQSLQRSRGRRE